MRKSDERDMTDSCWNKADDDEIVFVILARDIAATPAIHAWADARLSEGKNLPDDFQVVNALACAVAMDAQRLVRGGKEVVGWIPGATRISSFDGIGFRPCIRLVDKREYAVAEFPTGKELVDFCRHAAEFLSCGTYKVDVRYHGPKMVVDWKQLGYLDVQVRANHRAWTLVFGHLVLEGGGD